MSFYSSILETLVTEALMISSSENKGREVGKQTIFSFLSILSKNRILTESLKLNCIHHLFSRMDILLVNVVNMYRERYIRE